MNRKKTPLNRYEGTRSHEDGRFAVIVGGTGALLAIAFWASVNLPNWFPAKDRNPFYDTTQSGYGKSGTLPAGEQGKTPLLTMTPLPNYLLQGPDSSPKR